MAVINNDVEKIKIMIRTEKNNEKRQNIRNNAFLFASEWGKLKIVQAMKEDGVDVNKRSSLKDKLTGLMWAAWNGHYDVAMYLLENRADIHMKAENKNRTPFFFASQSGNSNIVLELLKRGADVNTFDYQKITPLMNAVRNKDDKMIDILLSRDADPRRIGDNYKIIES